MQSARNAIVFLYCISGAMVYSQAPGLDWAIQAGAANLDQGNSIVLDSAGSSYVCGCFQGSTDFDPGPGTFTLNSAGSSDAFVCKFDNNGNLLWAKQFGGVNYDCAWGIALDHKGWPVVCGDFTISGDFNPGPATFNLTSVGVKDIFLMKLTPAGNLSWAGSWGGISTDEGNSVATDTFGNIFAGGTFKGTVDFDPGPGTFTIVPPSSADQSFFSKFDSAGNLIWAKQLGGIGNDGRVRSFIDKKGNAMLSGIFAGSGDFDPGPGIFTLNSAGSFDVYVCKLDTAGDFLWAFSIGLTSDDRSGSVAADQSGNLLITGWFTGTVDFDPGAGTFYLSSPNYKNIFVAKYSPGGNLVWARQMGSSTADDFGYHVKSDNSGNVYSTGTFIDSADFDPGSGLFIISGFFDAFVSKLDSAGNFVFVSQLGGAGAAFGYSLALGPDPVVFVTGTFLGNCDFDPSLGNYSLTSAGNYDIFVAKLDNSGILPIADLGFAAVCNSSAVELTFSRITGPEIPPWTIERSSDLVIWEKLQERDIEYFPGNALIEKEKVIDLFPLPIDSWYRLKFQGSGLTTWYSQPVIARSCRENSFHCSLFPNPSSGEFYVRVAGNFESINIEIIDIFGVVVESRAHYNQGLIAIDRVLLPGLYFVKVKCGAEEKMLIMIRLSDE